jgi:hypothetical protein
MSKNLIPEIAKMLGVEMYEIFKIEGMDEDVVFRLGVNGLEMERFDFAENDRIWVTLASCNFVDLLTGVSKIIKLPWKPKKGEKYWSFRPGAWMVTWYTWDDSPLDFAFYKVGWVFHTKKEAQAALPAVAKELGVEYQL